MFKTVELGEVLNYEQPTRYIVESDIYNDEYDVPVLTAGKSFILGYTNEKENIYQNYPVIIFDDFTTATKYVDFPFKVKSSAMKILSCDENIADIKFLFYLIQTIKINSEQHQRYWISKFSKIQIPLPSLVTQKAIAEKLDKADALRKKDQELLKQYDELAQSIFIDMFGDPVQNEKGWEKNILKNCCSKIGSGSTPRGGKESYKSEGISLIRSMNVYDREFLYKDLAYIDDLQAEKLKNVIVEKGDVLFNITGASVCRCTVVPKNILPARVNQHVAILRTKFEIINNYFLNNLLISNPVKSNLLRIGSGGGAVMEAITKEQLENFEIIIPPLELQNQFAEKIKNIEAQKELVKKQAEASENLFQALLQESFNFT
ncbi:restriction endonuclease subunit S [Empedobacter sp.]|uniref:restriction endonuclease subunit S n=1 Tax=Empedobacter sp. TaxID=1927715 RepID=UPI00289C3687|nr:restriction endonuclease subunit S [Empedobacter sp.]